MRSAVWPHAEFADRYGIVLPAMIHTNPTQVWGKDTAVVKYRQKVNLPRACACGFRSILVIVRFKCLVFWRVVELTRHAERQD